MRRSLYGFVDWNIPDEPADEYEPVEAYTASWIEILTMAKEYRRNSVEAYTASWIEI